LIEYNPCRYHGADGMNRWVGLGVIANNLMKRPVSEPAARSRTEQLASGHFFTRK